MSIDEIICLGLIGDIIIGIITLLVFNDDEIYIPLYSPIKLHENTKMNWFGCIFIYVFMHLLFFPIYIIFDLNILFHIGRK